MFPLSNVSSPKNKWVRSEDFCFLEFLHVELMRKFKYFDKKMGIRQISEIN